LGRFATACLKQQYYIRTNLTETFNSISLMFLLNTIHLLKWVYIFTFYMHPFFPFSCSLRISQFIKHIKIDANSRFTKNVTHKILL